jgi:hypothetical protein
MCTPVAKEELLVEHIQQAARFRELAASATATATGRPARVRSSCASRSCGGVAATSRPSSSLAAWPKALTAVVQEAYVQGISTRSVDDLVRAMGMEGISKSQVSRL